MSHSRSTDEHTDWNAFGNRLRKMHKHLGKWARRQGISSYRLYDHDLPDQPAVIDWYDGSIVVWTKRRTRDDTEEADWSRTQRLLTLVEETLNPQHIFHKRRRRQQGRQHVGEDGIIGQYGKTGETGHYKEVTEHGRRFMVNLSEYLDVGLFLDHRPTRKLVGDKSGNKSLLNLFAYTGSFSVYAATGGARETTTVDLSHRYLSWATENMQLNNIGVDDIKHKMVKSDSLRFVHEAKASGKTYDIIVCDPPTFSNSKGLDSDFSVDRDHPVLLEALGDILAPEGSIIFSTNSRHFPFQLPKSFIAKDLSKSTTDKDFERRPGHLCWEIKHLPD